MCFVSIESEKMMRCLKHDQKIVVRTLFLSAEINGMNDGTPSDLEPCTAQLSSKCSCPTLFSPRTKRVCPHCVWGAVADLCTCIVLFGKSQTPETGGRVKQYRSHGAVLKHVLSLFSLLV